MSLSASEKLEVLGDMVHGREPGYMRRDWSLTNGGIADSMQEATNCDPKHGLLWELFFWWME